VRAYVNEPDLGSLHAGMNVQIYTDSYPNKSYQGWIGYISSTAEFTPKTVETTELRTKLVYRVRILTCDPQNELRLGMPVTVMVDPSGVTAKSPSCQGEE
jgi:HlyD family secretion protein